MSILTSQQMSLELGDDRSGPLLTRQASAPTTRPSDSFPPCPLPLQVQSWWAALRPSCHGTFLPVTAPPQAPSQTLVLCVVIFFVPPPPPSGPTDNSIPSVAVNLVAAIFTAVITAQDHSLGPGRDSCIPPAMFATEGQDPTQGDQDRADGGADRDPGLVEAPVVPLAEGSDEFVGAAAFLASQAVARALLEEEGEQEASQPTVEEDRDVRSAEQEEDLEEGKEEEEEEQDYDGEEEDEYEGEDHNEEVQEEGAVVIVGVL